MLAEGYGSVACPHDLRGRFLSISRQLLTGASIDTSRMLRTRDRRP
jgi:hypothetical protein